MFKVLDTVKPKGINKNKQINKPKEPTVIRLIMKWCEVLNIQRHA